MGKRLFDTWEQKKLCSLINDDPVDARARFEKYILEYPDDYVAYPYYANALLTLGDSLECEVVLEHVKKLIYGDKKFISNKSSMNFILENISFVELKLLMYKEDYPAVYRYLKENREHLTFVELSQIEFLCRKKNNYLKTRDKSNKSYLFRQIIEYDYDDFIDHIEKHQAKYVMDTDTANLNTFNLEFPLEKVLEEVKKNIPSDKSLFVGFIQDRYTFKYDGCGRINGKLVDYFDVVTFHNTTDFITMYPTDEVRTNTP